MTDIPSGYKQTEVGVIPEDWDVKAVHEFASIKTGPFGTLLKATEYAISNGVPLISVGEIRQGFLKITDDTPRVPDNVVRRLPQYMLKNGDIVFGRKGGVERSALIRREQDGWFLGSDGISLRPSKQCSEEYLALQFQSNRVQGWLIQNAIGTTMASLNQEILKKVTIPLPPTKAEQEAIAEALSDADTLIESLEQLIVKKRHFKQGAMQELLTGKKRLLGFETVGAIHGLPLQNTPHGWALKRLGDIAEIVMGQSPRSSNYNAKGLGLPLIQGNADIANRQTIRRIFTTEITKRGKRGDILMSVRAPVGEISRAVFDVCLGRGVCAIRYANDFMYHYLISQEPSWARLSKGSTFDSVNSADVKSLEVCLPDNAAEQTAIATILSDMDAEIAALETRLVKTRQIKQGMMQELLTGKTRLI